MNARSEGSKELWDNVDVERGGAVKKKVLIGQNLLASPSAEPGQPKQSERPNTAFLNGLRGLAALLVYMSHHYPWWYGGNSDIQYGFGYHGKRTFVTFPFINTLVIGGSPAVATFFILSGYVLSIAPLRVLRERGTAAAHRRLLSAFIRRPLKLFIPTLAVSLGFALMMQLPFGLAPEMVWPVAKANLVEELKNWAYESAIMMNPFKKHGIDAHWYPYNPPAWTMGLEYEGSMLVFAMLAVAAFMPRYKMALFCATGIFLFAIYQWPLACFMGGVVLAINDVDGIDHALLQRYSKQTINLAHDALFIISWWIVCQPLGKEPERSYATPGWYLLTMLTPPNYWKAEYWRFWNSIGAFIFVYVVLRVKWLQAFFMSRRMKWLGRISFALYLLHILVIWTIGDRICRAFGSVRQPELETWFDYKLAIPDVGPLGLTTGFLAAQALIMPITMFLADLCTTYLVEPSVKITHAFVARLGIEKEGF